MAVRVHAADIPDREGAEYALRGVLTTDCAQLGRVIADRAYRGADLAAWVHAILGMDLAT